MKRKWIVSRQYRQCPDGEARWDRAYQHLLQWATAESAQTIISYLDAPSAEMEPDHANGSVCPSFYAATSAKSNH